jgi:DNA helicase-2/ATP-dependent DNA helicase PcrA
MKLTNPQRAAVLHDGNTLVEACPGSGKTRALAAKLLRCADEVRGSPRRIGCITYTTAAVYEIESRVQEYGVSGEEDYCDVSTIHAFCLNNVLRFFHWRLSAYRGGFTVLPSDSDRFGEIAREVCSAHDLDRRAIEQFELLGREPDGSPIVASPLTDVAAREFWRRLEEEGAIDFPSMIYWSYCLMTEWPSIADALAARFAWILVDEFQDTSALQVEILKLLAARGKTRFFLVGDPYQSIFGFAGARGDLFETFGLEVDAGRNWQLLDNFRSSRPVIEHAERLFRREPAMRASGEAARFEEEPEWVHVATPLDAITDYFLPKLDALGIPYGKAAILAPWWVTLLHLGRALREYGVPIMGPGARPYKRAHLFALLAEQVCMYIEEPDPRLIPRVERELFNLVGTVAGRFDYSVFGYKGRRTVMRLVGAGKAIREDSESGLLWLQRGSEAFSEILEEEGFLSEADARLLKESVADMEEEMKARGVDVQNLSVADIGMFASGERNMRLLTMHGAKGREFDAVAIVDLHEGKVPHSSARTVAEVEEGKRLLYVAITRARRVLMYVTDDKDGRAPSRFLGAIGLGLEPLASG